jgi:hypothetical protein
MPDTTFDVSPEATKKRERGIVDYVGELRTALRRPIEQHWLPRNPVVACDEDHALLTAMCFSFYDHVPLRLTPDAVWITLARGFALHVNLNAEELRHRFVRHSGQKKLNVTRMDFLPGNDNPWPEVFAGFADRIDEHTGGLSSIVRADFSTTGPTELAASHLMAMDTFKSYFEYELFAGCGIPCITLAGTEQDWNRLRQRAQQFTDYGLENWISALDPILQQFCNAKRGNVDNQFWKCMFRYNSGSGPAVMTGWVNVLFPYFKDSREQLYANPYLNDWQQRLEIDDRQQWRDRWDAPQGIGIGAVPNCMTSVPLTVHWGTEPNEMRLVGGLLAVTQHPDTATVEPECGWVVAYETPVDELSDNHRMPDEGMNQERQHDEG